MREAGASSSQTGRRRTKIPADSNAAPRRSYSGHILHTARQKVARRLARQSGMVRSPLSKGTAASRADLGELVSVAKPAVANRSRPCCCDLVDTWLPQRLLHFHCVASLLRYQPSVLNRRSRNHLLAQKLEPPDRCRMRVAPPTTLEHALAAHLQALHWVLDRHLRATAARCPPPRVPGCAAR